jgi:3-dehydroquinate synthase
MRVDVELGDRGYPVHVVDAGLGGLGAAMAARLPPGRVLVVTNPVVAHHHLGAALESLTSSGFTPEAVLVPDGERHKNLDTWRRLVGTLLRLRPTRRTPIVALGGGVTGDLAGFAAASLLRGVPLVQVPTSLLAMVDSSVGGKTGVNAEGGKNLVGAFHQPSLVYAALGTLSTLPSAELRCGLGEGLKHGVVVDAGLLDFMEAEAGALAAGDPEALGRVVVDSVRAKAAVVAEDEREAGRRVVLNFGHTVGHAIESVLGWGALRHGECVGLGMLAECRWAARERGGDASLESRVQATLRRMGLPVHVDGVPLSRAIDAARVDKKWARGTLRTAIPIRAGFAALASVPAGEIPGMLRCLPGVEEDC